jgi:hypothetical protein
MANQKEISEDIALAFEHIRATHATLSAVMVEVAVLRQFILKSPKMLRQYRRALAVEIAKVRSLAVTAMRAYEKEILRIKSGGEWKN